MKSIAINTSSIELPLMQGEYSMIPFIIDNLNGLTDQFKRIAQDMLKGITHNGGKAFFTIHGIISFFSLLVRENIYRASF